MYWITKLFYAAIYVSFWFFIFHNFVGSYSDASNVVGGRKKEEKNKQ